MLSVRESKIGDIDGRRVLDFGAGAGRHAYWAFTKNADVVAVDISFDELSDAPQYFDGLKSAQGGNNLGSAVQASGLDLPFSNCSFDVVIASEVFEHIRNESAALDEITRVLRPGGILAVSVPRFWPEAMYWAISSEYHNVEGGHIRIYRRSSLRRLIREGGFRVYCSHHSHSLHTPYWLIRCLVGIDNEESSLYRVYHKFLVWDITKKPKLTRYLDAALNPIFGKSLVVYAVKVQHD